jgi:hypothetical protein
MVLRTKSAVAYNAGTVNAGREHGVVWYEVFDGPHCGWDRHDSGDLAIGKIIRATEALMVPLAHPNCRRSFGARPDLSTRAEAVRARPSTKPEQIADQVAADLVRTGQLD